MALQQIANTDISSTGTFALGSISSSTLTSGRVTYATTGGLLTDSSSLTFNGSTLTASSLSGGNITNSGLTSGRITFAGTAGLLQDSANLTFNGTTLTANTIGAFTLGGTIAGGGNQINNVIIGTSTPLAGSFTTINASTSITNAGLTSGRVTFATTSGLLTDSSTLTYDGTTLTTPRLALGGTTLPSAGTATLFLRSSDNSTYLQTGSGNNIYFLDGSQNTMLSLTPSSLAFQISNAAKLTLNSTTLHTANGISVGIGTDSPYGLLNIKGSNGQLVLANGNTSGGMKLTSSNSIYTGNGYLAFEGYANEYGRFDSSGNFGIGAISLAANFHISKSTTATVMISNISTSLVTDDAMGLIDFSAGSSNTVNARISGLVVGTSEAGGSLAVETRTDGGSLTEKFRITGAGNVGIGTSSPLGKLHISTTDMFAAYKTYSGLGNTGAGDAVFDAYRLDGALLYKRVLDIVALGDSTNSRESETRFFTTNLSGSTAERLRITGAGNVGIGTSSPAYKLVAIDTGNAKQQITFSDNASFFGSISHNSGTGQNEYRTEASGGHGWFIGTSSTTANMTLDSSGDVLIGTTSSTTWNGGTTKRILAVANANSGDANAIVTLKSNASTVDHGGIFEAFSTAVTAGSAALGSIGFVRENTSNTQLNSVTTFFTNRSGVVAERARISSLGNLLIGTPTQLNATNARVVVSFDNNNYYGMAMGGTAAGGAGMVNFYSSTGVEQGYISTSGSATTTYSTSSDYRLKENIQPMTGALAKVAQLKPVTYKWKADGSDGQGFIAHELAEVVPDCVTREKDGVDADGKPVYQGVDTSFLVATLVSAIQEQQALIESMATKLKDAGVAGF